MTDVLSLFAFFLMFFLVTPHRYGWPFQRENMDVVSIRLEPDTVIQGFVQGVTGMREGGKRRLLIPRGESLKF